MEGWNMFIMRTTHVRLTKKKYAHSGNAYVAMVVLHSADVERTFLETPLICKLEKGKKYQLHFFLKIPDKYFHPLQVFFSNQEYLAHNVWFNDSVPQFEINQTNLVKPATIKVFKWMEFNKEFIAKGNEKYFVLGNFLKKFDNPNHKHREAVNHCLYYLMDDISLMASDSSVCDDYQANLQTIYQQDFRHSYWNENKTSTNEKKLVDRVHSTEIYLADSIIFSPKKDTLTLPEFLFAVDSFAILPKFETLLDSFYQAIQQQNFDSILIIGHTDNTGTEPHNLELSKNRALSIYHYLTIEKQIEPDKLLVQGKGSSLPIADNATFEGRRKNRRVEIIVFRE